MRSRRKIPLRGYVAGVTDKRRHHNGTKSRKTLPLRYEPRYEPCRCAEIRGDTQEIREGNSTKSQPAQNTFVPYHIDAVPLDEDAPAQTGLAVLSIVYIHRYHPAVIESGDVVKDSVSHDYAVRLIPVQDETEGVRPGDGTSPHPLPCRGTTEDRCCP